MQKSFKDVLTEPFMPYLQFEHYFETYGDEVLEYCLQHSSDAELVDISHHFFKRLRLEGKPELLDYIERILERITDVKQRIEVLWPKFRYIKDWQLRKAIADSVGLDGVATDTSFEGHFVMLARMKLRVAAHFNDFEAIEKIYEVAKAKFRSGRLEARVMRLIVGELLSFATNPSLVGVLINELDDYLEDVVECDEITEIFAKMIAGADPEQIERIKEIFLDIEEEVGCFDDWEEVFVLAEEYPKISKL